MILSKIKQISRLDETLNSINLLTCSCHPANIPDNIPYSGTEDCEDMQQSGRRRPKTVRTELKKIPKNVASLTHHPALQNIPYSSTEDCEDMQKNKR